MKKTRLDSLSPEWEESQYHGKLLGEAITILREEFQISLEEIERRGMPTASVPKDYRPVIPNFIFCLNQIHLPRYAFRGHSSIGHEIGHWLHSIKDPHFYKTIGNPFDPNYQLTWAESIANVCQLIYHSRYFIPGEPLPNEVPTLPILLNMDDKDKLEKAKELERFNRNALIMIKKQIH